MGFMLPGGLAAQSSISGDLAGMITDPSGAAVPNAKITVTNKATGEAKSASSNAAGNYRVSLLRPGSYTLTATAAGFSTESTEVTVAVGNTTTADLKLAVGQSSQTIEVTEAAPLLQTENADLSTQFTQEQTQNLPNPGNDITFYAQTVPGAIMNTQGGYGNFEVFGLPATSNNFTLNGGQEDDPFLNLNNSGPSNLLLGNNDIAEVNVITNAYSSEYGTFGGAQVVELSRSGSNKFHGNANYWYNGTVLNANNWFLNHQGSGRPGDVDNQWAASIGGPIIKDKTFFFVDYEGIRFVTTNTGGVYVPSPSFQASTLANIAASANPEVASEYSFYQNNIFGTYNNAKGANLARATSDPDVNTFESASKLNLHEWFLAGRVDQNFGPNDKAFFHVKVDKGVQPTYADPLTPAFDAQSVQPDYEAQLGYTHSFSASAVNQFLMAGSYYGAIFKLTNPSAAAAIMPQTLNFFDGSFSNLNADAFAFPQGRNVTQYQFQDDFSMTKGAHTLKVGGFFKRDDVSDFDMQQFTTPLLLAEKNFYGTFQNGGVLEELFNRQLLNPAAGNQPVALYALGLYVEDNWKPLPNFQLNAGIRFERDGVPASQQNNFVRLNGDFFNVASSVNTVTEPFSSFITAGHHSAFVHYTSVMPEPRIGFTFSPKADSNTVVRGGFGIFTDIFPGVIADNLFGNYPFSINVSTFADSNYICGLPSMPCGKGFTAQPVTTNLVQPNLPDSAASMAKNTGAIYSGAFNSSYASVAGSSPCPACTGLNSGIAPPNFTNAGTHIHYPTYEEWSLQVQHQFAKGTSVMVGYVGNHGYHEPVQNTGANAYALHSFAGLPAAAPAGGLGTVNEIYSPGSSNYNGFEASVQHRTKYLTAQLNYTWSHALDEVSNGGISPFGFGTGLVANQIDPYNLRYNYGNADYDSRHVINGNYLITVPYWGGPKLATDGWQLSGTVFFNTGYPFSVMDSATAPIANGWNYNSVVAGIPAQVSGESGHRCGKSGASGTVCHGLASATVMPATGFFQQGRNQFLGPHYFDTDFAVTKTIPIPHWEGATFKVGAQFYNILNHPNFSQPSADANAVGFGTITSMANPPTSIFGSFLGGDAAPRIIQFKGAISF